jgi:hypothetical protein
MELTGEAVLSVQMSGEHTFFYAPAYSCFLSIPISYFFPLISFLFRHMDLDS